MSLAGGAQAEDKSQSAGRQARLVRVRDDGGIEQGRGFQGVFRQEIGADQHCLCSESSPYIYEDREKARGFVQKEQAEAARDLAASAVTSDVAEGLSWYRKAVALDPDNMTGRIGLGDAAMAGGKLQEAGDAFRHYIHLARQIRSENGVYVGLNRLGQVQVAQGDLPSALTSYRDSLAISTGWRNPIPATHGSAICRCRRKIGDVQVAQGDLAGAVKSYRDSLAITERLAKSDPGNAGWQRDLCRV